ncbi:hypothetical protein ES702_07435 [subsurface metagenome]
MRLLVLPKAQLGELLEKEEFTKGGRGKTGSSGGTSLQDYDITKKESHLCCAGATIYHGRTMKRLRGKLNYCDVAII